MLYIITDQIYKVAEFLRSGTLTDSYIQNGNLPFAMQLKAVNSGSAVPATYDFQFGCASMQFFGRDTIFENFYSFNFNQSFALNGDQTLNTALAKTKNGYYKIAYPEEF